MEFHYDKKAAEKAVNWIEKYCTHTKGELGGMPFLLAPWQKEQIIKPAFGWKREDGTRKYRRIFVGIPRKNGKSTLGSALALYLLAADGEAGAEIYSAASDRGQAGIIHEDAKTMIKQNKDLSIRIQSFRNSIVYEKTASSYKVLSKAAENKHGFNSHGIIYDELHAAPNRELWDVLTTSIGARTQPIVFVFTTWGFDRNTICYEQYDYAKKVRDSIIQDDEFLPVIFESDPKADIQDPKVWADCNPSLGITGGLKIEYVKAEAQRAINEPGYENTFRRLQLNQWTQSETLWIPDDVWMKCKEKFTLQDFAGCDCFVGVDLASVRDTTSVMLLFIKDGKYFIWPIFYVPEATARERSKAGVSYDLWIKQGYIIETPGNVTDYGFIRRDLNQLKSNGINIRKIRYDKWNAAQFIPLLVDDGFECEEFSQYISAMAPPTKEVEKEIYRGNIRHTGNPVMRWMMSNVMITRDPNDNYKINKEKSKDKVDGPVSLVMAYGEAAGSETSSVYEERGILTL